MKLSENLQKLLPFGYLFLVIMGILKESVFFYQIGINILKYSTLMDILVSPIATLTANPLVLLAVSIVIALTFAFSLLVSKQRNKKWAQKLSSLKNKEQLSDEEINRHYTKVIVLSIGMGIFSFFVGMGIGEGASLKKKILTSKLSYDRTLTFSSGEAEQIYLISSNSIYYFYLSKGNNTVKIAPIGAIKHMDLTINKSLKP